MASTATFPAIRSGIGRPTALREKASIAAARQSRPSRAGMQVMPPTRSLFLSPTEKTRSTRSKARVARLSLLCGLMPPGRPFGGDPWLPHDMRHALPARDDAAAAQFSVDAPAAAAALTPAERIDDEPFERLALDPGIRLLPSGMLVEA